MKRDAHNLAAPAISIAFFVLAPGVVAGLIPWLITDGWARNDVPHAAFLLAPGATLVLGGAGALVHAFVEYVTKGFGTPAPPAPTEYLVIGGPNQYVRNPMYLAVVVVIVGQAMLLAQPVLVAYAAVAFAGMATFVYAYEEPTLERRFGLQYDDYRERVPRWIPRAPWRATH